MKDTEIQANFDHLQGLIEHLATIARAGFERTDPRFDRVETRLEGMDFRLEGLDSRLDQIDGRIDHLRDTTAEHFEALETRLNERLDRLEQRV